MGGISIATWTLDSWVAFLALWPHNQSLPPKHMIHVPNLYKIRNPLPQIFISWLQIFSTFFYCDKEWKITSKSEPYKIVLCKFMQNATECLAHTWKTAPAVLQLCCIMPNTWMYESLISAPAVATNEYYVGIKLKHYSSPTFPQSMSSN